MATVLVTGAGGFVGANLTRRLLADGHRVELLLRPGAPLWRLDGVLDDVRVHDADIADEERVHAAFAAAKPELVFHLAAHGGYSWQRDGARILAANVVGSWNVFDAAARAGARAVVNTGTSLEYGRKDHAPSEDEPLDPDGVYAVGKSASTHLAGVAARAFGLQVATLRLYSVYGAWEEPARLLPTLVVCALEKRLPQLVSPTTGRDFVWVDDVVDAYLLAARPGVRPGAVYNIGTGVQRTLREVVEVARRVFAIDAEPEWGTLDARDWDTQIWVSAPGLAEQELGWRASTGLEDGLQALSDWLRADPARLARYAEAAHSG